MEEHNKLKRWLAVGVLLMLGCGFITTTIPAITSTVVLADKSDSKSKDDDKDKDKNPTPVTSPDGSTPTSGQSADSGASSDKASSGSAGKAFASAAKSMAISSKSDNKVNILACSGDVWGALGSSKLPIGSMVSQFQSANNYSSMSSLDTSKNDSSFSGAGNWAYEMSATGLDKSAGNDQSAVEPSGFMKVIGWLENLVLSATNLSGACWRLADNLLQATNVFAWLQGVSTSSWLAGTQLAAFFHNMYTTVKDMGWAITSIVFAVSLAMAAMGMETTVHGQRLNPGRGIVHAFWMMFFRLITSFFMVPICFVAWGAFLTNIQPMFDKVASVNPSDDMILSTVVNNHDWAMKGRYTMANSINGVLKNTHDTDSTTPIITHEQIAAINQHGAGMKSVGKTSITGFNGGLTKQSDFLSSVDDTASDNSVTDPNINQSAKQVWDDYTSQATFTGGDYASYALSHLTDLENFSTIEDKQKVISIFEKNLANTDISNDNGNSSKNTVDNGKSDAKYTTGVSPLVNGSLRANGKGGTFTTSNVDAPIYSDQMGGALSTLGTYVYLSSAMSSKSFQYNDLSSATNSTVISKHFNSTIPTSGNALLHFTYMCQLIFIPLALLAFSIMCLLQMMTGCFASVVQALGMTPFAVSGSLKAAAKFVGAAFMMVANVVGCLVAYGVGMDLVSILINSIGSDSAGAAMPMSHHFGAIAAAGSIYTYIAWQLAASLIVLGVIFAFIKSFKRSMEAIKGTIEDMTSHVVTALTLVGAGSGKAISAAKNVITNHNHAHKNGDKNQQNNQQNNNNITGDTNSKDVNDGQTNNNNNNHAGDVNDMTNNPHAESVENHEGNKEMGNYGQNEESNPDQRDNSQQLQEEQQNMQEQQAGDGVAAPGDAEMMAQEDTEMTDASTESVANNEGIQANEQQNTDQRQMGGRQQSNVNQHSQSNAQNKTQAGRTGGQGVAVSGSASRSAGSTTAGVASSSQAAMQSQGRAGGVRSAGMVPQKNPFAGELPKGASEFARTSYAGNQVRSAERAVRQAEYKHNPQGVQKAQATLATAKRNALIGIGGKPAPSTIVPRNATTTSGPKVSYNSAYKQLNNVYQQAVTAQKTQSQADIARFETARTEAHEAGIAINSHWTPQEAASQVPTQMSNLVKDAEGKAYGK